MIRYSSVLALLVPIIIVAAGCHCMQHRYQPIACNDDWDPVLGTCNVCGVCGGDCEGHTPVQHAKHMLTCASGCGEIYWGEWLSDPPEACDPCDNWGNWIGPQGGGLSFWDCLASGWCRFWGYRQGGHDCGPECDTCGVAQGEVVEIVPPEAESLPPEPVLEDQASFKSRSKRPYYARPFSIRSTRLPR